MKQSKHVVETASEGSDQVKELVAAAEPMLGAWGEMVKRQSEWAMQSYAALFAPAQNPRLMESNAAGHALARSQAALARLREARETPEIMSLWAELSTSASAFAVGYWQQMMDQTVAGQEADAAASEGRGKSDRPGALFDGTWPLGFEVPASMFKLFSTPMNIALQATGKEPSSAH